MATLKLNGDTSGYVLLQAATVAQNNTLTLPNTTDTLVTSNGSVMNNATINGSTLFNPIITGSGTITGSLTGGTLSNTTLSSPTITGSWSQQNLNLVGTSALVGNGVYIPAANTVGFITNTTERMRLTSGGNLLINGTVTPLSGNATVVISGLGTNGGGLQLSGGTAGGMSQQSLNGGGLTWNTYTGAVGSETYAERMRLDSNGNLGVGVSTLSLGGRLTVGKASLASFTGAASGVMTVSDTSSTLNSYTALDFTNTNQQLPLARIAMQFTNSGSYLSLGTTNSYGSGVNNSAMTIDPNGNIGIGTSSPISTLDINGNVNVRQNLIANTTGTQVLGPTIDTAVIPGFSWVGEYNSGMFNPVTGVVAFSTAGAERMRITGAGNVGIANTNPAFNLVVNNTVNGTVAQFGNGSYIGSYNNSAYFSSSYFNANATWTSPTTGASIVGLQGGPTPSIAFYVDNVLTAGSTYGPTQRMIISGNGNVGIGSTTPQQTLDVSGNVNVLNTVIMGSSFLRNRIINGAMQVDQRNSGASGTAISVYTVDRWLYGATQASKGTWGQNLNSAALPAGFSNYLGFQSSSAYAVLTSDQFFFRQSIEGFNFSDFGFGTASAKTITLSFAVYSSLTGTFSGSFTNYAFSRSYPFTYSIASANTWTTVAVTIPGDTGGTWVGATSAGAALVWFSLGVGSTFTGTAGVWATASYAAATGAVSVVGTSGATFYITGVQLEQGPVATPFERKLIGQVLTECQRYFYKQGGISASEDFGTGWFTTSTSMNWWAQMPVTMRNVPSIATTGSIQAQNFSNSTFSATVAINSSESSNLRVGLSATVTGATAGVGGVIRAANDLTASIQYSSEI